MNGNLQRLHTICYNKVRGREAWYLARPITLRPLVQIQSPQ